MVLSNQGNLLRLRQTVPDDAPILLRAYQDESFIHLYRSNNAQQTEEQLRKILADRLEHDPTQFGHVEFYCVELSNCRACRGDDRVTLTAPWPR